VDRTAEAHSKAAVVDRAAEADSEAAVVKCRAAVTDSEAAVVIACVPVFELVVSPAVCDVE
jgi:hypothetical protein